MGYFRRFINTNTPHSLSDNMPEQDTAQNPTLDTGIQHRLSGFEYQKHILTQAAKDDIPACRGKLAQTLLARSDLEQIAHYQGGDPDKLYLKGLFELLYEGACNHYHGRGRQKPGQEQVHPTEQPAGTEY
jgi:hypothetical protein